MHGAEKNIPKLLKDKQYLENLFRPRLKDINPAAVKILKIESYPIKKHRDKNFFHFVIQHQLKLELAEGLYRRYRIYCVSFSDNGRLKMFQVMKFLYEHGLDRGPVITPRPLWYIKELMAFFYVGVQGESLLEHIKNNCWEKNVVKKIATGLRKIHQMKAARLPLQRHRISRSYLDPTDVLERDYNVSDQLSRAIKDQLKILQKYFAVLNLKNYPLSHGDFHPENVIINKFNAHQPVIIDFSESCFAPRYYDLGSFLQQFEFMTRKYLQNDQFVKTEKTFLEAYFDEEKYQGRKIKIINFYKAWTALKSAVYFMIFKDEDNRNYARYLLNKSREYLRRAE